MTTIWYTKEEFEKKSTPVSQQVINLLVDADELSKKSSPANKELAVKLRKEAMDLISLHKAEKLFVPDETLGKNVLHYAISTGNALSAIALINKEKVTSEQLFHQDTHGYTPLHEAIENGHEMVARELIKKATTVEQLECATNVPKNEKTALQMAHDHHMPKVKLEIETRINYLQEPQKKLRPERFKRAERNISSQHNYR